MRLSRLKMAAFAPRWMFINLALDALDANDGYCPCQIQSEDTKCHCKDFLENKKIGEPCICKIYVKQPAKANGKIRKSSRREK